MFPSYPPFKQRLIQKRRTILVKKLFTWKNHITGHENKLEVNMNDIAVGPRVVGTVCAICVTALRISSCAVEPAWKRMG